MKSILITGNPVDGFTFIGPFEDKDEAIAYAEDMDPDWWVAPVEDPAKWEDA